MDKRFFVVSAVLVLILFRGRVMRWWEFVVAVALLVSCILVETKMDQTAPFFAERFAEGFTDTFSGVFSTLQAIPGAVQDTLTPALDRLIDTVSHSGGDTMDASMYADDAYVTTKNEPDDAKFAAMVAEYESIDALLTAMKHYNNPLYTALCKES